MPHATHSVPRRKSRDYSRRREAFKDCVQVGALGQVDEAWHVLDDNTLGPQISGEPQHLAVQVVSLVPDDTRSDDREALARGPGEEEIQLPERDSCGVSQLVSVHGAEVSAEELTRQARPVRQAALRINVC